MKLLIAIPCLNEASTIGDVISSIPKFIAGITATTVLVIDDGSTDDTARVAQDHGAIILRHPINRGVGVAFRSATDYATDHDFDIMVNIDGDRQFDPADIQQLVAPIINGIADMVTASRFKNPALQPVMPRVKLVGNHMMSYLISKLCSQRFHDVSCGFRAYSKETLLKLNLHGAFTYTQETFLDLISKRLRIVEVPIRVIYFPERKSRVASSILKYATHSGTIILRIYRDYFPLKFFLSISLLFLLIGGTFGTFFFYHYLISGRFTGNLYAGFLGGFFIAIALIFAIVAIVMDMLDRMRVNQERILYLLKKRKPGHEQ